MAGRGRVIEHGVVATGLCSGGAALPRAARPAGIAITLEGEMFRLVVTDRAGAPLLRLGPYDEDDVVAIWQSIAAASGLPLLVSYPDGRLVQAFPQVGPLVVGPCSDRRRLAVLTGRRPRFLVRRKAARLPRRPIIYREKEIATGRGR